MAHGKNQTTVGWREVLTVAGAPGLGVY